MFFTCVRNYIEHGATASFYKLRATLLYLLYSSANHTITCEDNVCDLFSKLMRTYNVNIETIKCQNSQCCAVESRNIPIFNLSAKIVWEKGIQHLNQSVDELICTKIIYCQSCHKNLARKIVQIHNYLCLNIEHFYEPSIRFPDTFPNTNLNDIPATIKLQDKRYILCGVIRFIPSTIVNGIGHYVAYVRSLSNKWTEINDLCKETKNIINLPAIRISLLFYVLVQENESIMHKQ